MWVKHFKMGLAISIIPIYLTNQRKFYLRQENNVAY